MNNNIHVVLDSVSCVGETNLLQEEARVHVLRLVARMGNEEWYDGDVSPDDIVAMIKKTGKLPQTSQPPLGDMLNLFTDLVKQGKKVIFPTISSGLSGTYQAACIAAQQVMDEVKGADIRVIDSKSGGLLCTDAARQILAKADSGCEDMDELEAFTRELFSRSVSLFMVETLDHLKAGGRIGKASALLGSIFGIRPILTLDEDGKVIPADKCRTRKKALKRIMDLASERGELENISVHGSFCPEDAAYVAEEMSKRFPDASVETCELDAVLMIHLGPGLIGLFGRTKA